MRPGTFFIGCLSCDQRFTGLREVRGRGSDGVVVFVGRSIAFYGEWNLFVNLDVALWFASFTGILFGLLFEVLFILLFYLMLGVGRLKIYCCNVEFAVSIPVGIVDLISSVENYLNYLD